MTVPDKPWKVLVDDNFDYHETAQTPVADFDTREEAIAYCCARVETRDHARERCREVCGEGGVRISANPVV